MTTKNKFEGCEAVLWYDGEDEVVLVARGSGDNIDQETDCELVKHPDKFLGMNGKRIWKRVNDEDSDEDQYDFAERVWKKLSKTYPNIKGPEDVSDAWEEWCEKNVRPYDCETYAMIFNLSDMEQGDVIREALRDPEQHEFDVWPTGFEIDGQTFEEDEAEVDGGLQTTFDDSTPPVYDPRQLAESLGMCGASFGECTTRAQQVAYARKHYKVVAGV